jgi:hypothetical protein
MILTALGTNEMFRSFNVALRTKYTSHSSEHSLQEILSSILFSDLFAS